MVITKVPWSGSENTNPFLNNTKVNFGDHENVCLLLINHGANVNFVRKINDTNTGWTLLHSALIGGYDLIGESLIKAGANINVAELSHGWTPLHLTYKAASHSSNGADLSHFL